MTPLLRFLADESCDFAVVRALRSEGYDVLAVSEYTQRSDDLELIHQSFQENRVLLTENARQTLASTVLRVVHERAEEITGAFVVVQPGYVRISQKP
jgi:uncharacterized protein with PIN domain